MRINELRLEIEEIRLLLNTAIADEGINDSNYNVLLDISTRMDKLIVEFMRKEVE